MSIYWKENGWTELQIADAEKHRLGINCRAENGVVVEVTIRHHDGEERKGSVKRNGEPVLPIALDEFRELFEDGELEIR